MGLSKYEQVMSRAVAAMERSGRDPAELTVVAVSKEQPIEAVLELYEAGHRDWREPGPGPRRQGVPVAG